MQECTSSYDTTILMHEKEKDKVVAKCNSDNNSNNSKEKVTGAVPKQKQTGKKNHNKQNGGGRASSEAPHAAQLMPEVQYASAPTTPGRLLSPEPTTTTGNNGNNNSNSNTTSQVFPMGETATADDAQGQRKYNL
jgi:hypothetical protein